VFLVWDFLLPSFQIIKMSKDKESGEEFPYKCAEDWDDGSEIKDIPILKITEPKFKRYFSPIINPRWFDSEETYFKYVPLKNNDNGNN